MFDPARYTEQFSREHGLDPWDWDRLLPEAVAGHALQRADQAATVVIGDGQLSLRWRMLPPLQIALMRMPRLQVDYQFSGVPDEPRVRFMRRFDLHMQRGGG